MLQQLKKLYRSRDLLLMLTLRDFKLRYKQTVMGVLWAVLMPAAIVMAGLMIRLVVQKSGLQGMHLSSIIIKSLPWAFFVSSLKFSTTSLAGNQNLIAKMAFPKEVFPLSSVASCFVDFCVSLIVGVVALVLLGHHFPSTTPFALLMIVPLVALVAGLGLLLSSLNLFFRDVKYIVEVVLMFAIFFTPVLYSAEMLGRYQSLIMLNPIAPLLEAMEASAVRGTWPDPFWTVYACVFAFVTLAFGYHVFKSLEHLFAERA
jgi:ABC-type polysaccharide/polyol phosphate export permease